MLTAEVQLPAGTYPTPADVVRFYRTITEQLAALPGVDAAGAVRVLPLSRTIGDWSIKLEGRPYSPAENPNADFQAVTPGYFDALGLRVRRGRGLTAADREDALPVAVINETMAARYWPGQEAIGQRFIMGTDDKPWLTVVGVVGQVRHNAIVEEPRAEMYIAHAQLPAHIGSAPRGMALVVKTRGDAAALVPELRAAVRALDPQLALGNVRTMDDLAATHVANARFTALMLGAFAALAALLALVGLYGAVSLVTDERAPEIGVRLALGAERGSILRLVLGEGVALAVGGGAARRRRVGAAGAGDRRSALRRHAARPDHVRRRAAAVLGGRARRQPDSRSPRLAPRSRSRPSAARRASPAALKSCPTTARHIRGRKVRRAEL